MKKLSKLLLVLFFAAAVVTVTNFLPTLQAGEQIDEFAALSKNEEIKIKIDGMRKGIHAAGLTFTVEANPSMQYTISQLCNFKPELKPADQWGQSPIDSNDSIDWASVKPVPLPESYIADYTSIKNQGACGACWAFSTAGMFESVLLKQGISADLSEQWLVSCNDEGWGCNGGWFANSYYLNPGAVLESCFRYKAKDLECKTGCAYVYIADSTHSASNVAAIKNAIKTYGAVSSAVTVTSYFQAYSSGVFNYDSTASVNHAVVLVGWDDTLGANGAWRMKNSWGSGWGESGMMWIEYGCSNIGYGGNYLEY